MAQLSADERAHFRTLDRLRPPRAVLNIALAMLVTIAVFVAFAALTPWVQTAPGTGTVIARDPRDRQQTISAMVVCHRWQYREGRRSDRARRRSRSATARSSR
jgi:hypothetical protein